jgi:transcriptional regulator with XRE-family HTH domain
MAMTGHDWTTGRRNAGLTQVQAAKTLGVSQPYLSQLEKGSRVGSRALEEHAASFYRLPPTVLPLPEAQDAVEVKSDRLQNDLAALGYPGFAHVRSKQKTNPTAVLFMAVVQRNLDTRIVEALPWVVCAYPDLDWPWLRDRAKLRNVQNRLGYIVYLAKELEGMRPDTSEHVKRLSLWERELEDARLAREDTLCHESMPERERSWLKTHRPLAAQHWNLLTSLTKEHLSYAAK